MKTSNIISKLEKIEATNFDIIVIKAQYGWFVRATAKIGGYYDFELTDQLIDREHRLSYPQVISWFRSQTTDNFATKPYHDKDDWQVDYCAWSFHRKINDLDYLNAQGNAFTNNPTVRI